MWPRRSNRRCATNCCRRRRPSVLRKRRLKPARNRLRRGDQTAYVAADVATDVPREPGGQIADDGTVAGDSRGALAAALKLLSRREYCSMQLQQRLLEQGFAAATVDDLIVDLKRRRYVDDERFAALFVTSHVGAGTDRCVSGGIWASLDCRAR